MEDAEKLWMMVRTIEKMAILFIAATVFASIFYFRPYWGLMDDHFIALDVIPEIASKGLFQYITEFARADLAWGMFRPTYPLMMAALYLPAVNTAPWVLFAWNAALCFALLFYLSRVFARLVGADERHVLLFALSFPYTYDLFQHPSLQEKMVHLCGAGLLYLLSRKKRGPFVWISIIAISVLGDLVKASFCIYLSMAVWMEFSREPEARMQKRLLKALPMACWLLLSLCFFAYISSLGQYTAGNFSVSKVLPNIISRNGIALFSVLGFALAYALVRKIYIRAPLELTPVIGLMAFLAIFLPWGIGGYLLATAAPMLSAVLAYLAERLSPARLRPALFVFLCALAVTVGIYRSVTMFGRLGDVRQIVTLAASWQEAGLKEIIVPCEEGRGAVERFFAHAGAGQIKVARFPSSSAHLDGKHVLFDSAMCPLPGGGSAPVGCVGQPLFEGVFRGSYRVMKFQCAVSGG